MSTKPALPIILAAAILAGCAHTGAHYTPMVDMRTAGGNYSQDLAECQAYANQRAGAADSAIVGAVFGALLGVALLAAGGGRGGWGNEAAAVGAVAGGLQGAAANEVTQRDIIKRCLAGRGYSVLN